MAYTVAFLSLQFFELYRADPDFRYQLLQVLQQAERAEYADEQQHPVSFRTTDTFLRVFGLSSLADLPPVHSDAPADDPTESEG